MSVLPLSPPQSYAEWSQYFDLLAVGERDEAVLAAMAGGTGDFQSGAVENVARRLIEVFDARLKGAHAAFARQMLHSRDAATLGRALLDFRRQLSFLARVAQLEAWPELLQKQLNEMLDKNAETTQSSLEASAKNDRSGQMALWVRQNSLMDFRAQTVSVAPEISPQDAREAISFARRKRNFLS